MPSIAMAFRVPRLHLQRGTDAMFAYVGSRTTKERNARGEGISVYDFDPSAASLERLQVVDGLVNPSYLLLHPNKHVLYTVHGDQCEVSAFRVDVQTGQLSVLNRQDCRGRNPVHLALSPCGGYLVVSNHVSSSLAVLPIAEDGALEPVCQLVELAGQPGPHRVEQPFAKPHFNPFTPDGRFVLVPDKGLDKVFVFAFESGCLTPATTPWVTCREGAGPRHLAFHPQKPWVYTANELDSTVTVYSYRPDSGELKPFQVVSAMADSYTGNSRAAGIVAHPNGRALYVSNRGEDSIAVFSVDAGSGRISLMQTMPSGGRTPRFFTLDPTGQWLLVLNEDSDRISMFAVKPDTGMLNETGTTWVCGSPVCMVFGSL